MEQIQIEGVEINIIQKKIKNIHLRVYPPSGEVRLSVPKRMTLSEIKTFIILRLSWIRDKQNKIRDRKITMPLKYLDGEEHYFFGKKYILKIFEKKSAPLIFIRDGIIELHIKKRSSFEQRKKIISEWQRREMKNLIPQYIAALEIKMKVKVHDFGIKKMKTRWGTCNIRAKRIWLNLELAKRPIACLEYIIVHEMAHLLERSHNKKFIAHMDHFLPNWREIKKILTLSSSM